MLKKIVRRVRGKMKQPTKNQLRAEIASLKSKLESLDSTLSAEDHIREARKKDISLVAWRKTDDLKHLEVK